MADARSSGARRDDLDRAVSRVLLASFAGHDAPDWLRRRLDDGLGGVLLFARNVASPGQVARLTASLREHAPEVLCAVDEEGGDVTRLHAASGSPHPGHLSLGVADDVAGTRAVAADIGREMRAAGVGWDLAPVADVARGPDSPVVGVRSFGSDPAAVARHVGAFVAGLQDDAGVAACAKHFPGHGGTDVDSHRALPRLARDRAELDRVDLAPFRAAITAGVRAVMVGHLLVPALDPDRPATRSPAVVQGLLRGEFGFTGLVVCDALEMAGASASIGIEAAAVAALAAGVDLLCLGGEHADDDVVARVHAALRSAVLSSRLPESRLREAGARVGALAAWCRDRPPPGPAGPLPPAAVRCDGDVVLGPAPPCVVTLDSQPGVVAGRVPWGLDDLLRRARPGTRCVRAGEGDAVDDVDRRIGERPLVLVVRDPDRHPWQRDLAATLAARHPRAVVVDMGVPGASVAALGRGRVRTFGAFHAAAVAAVAALCPTTTTGGAP